MSHVFIYVDGQEQTISHKTYIMFFLCIWNFVLRIPGRSEVTAEFSICTIYSGGNFLAMKDPRVLSGSARIPMGCISGQ